MKVEIRVSEEATEPYAILYTNQVSEGVRRLAAMIEAAEDQKVVVASEDERWIVLRPEEIFLVRVEEQKTVVYTRDKRYKTTLRLYEAENALKNDFMRISKAALVNLRQLDCVEPSFGGSMLLILKNGCKEYISRKYLPSFKQYLGL